MHPGVYEQNGFGRYEGTFAKDEYYGVGIYTWVNGWRYEGEWMEGKMHGTGRIYDPSDKIRQQGVWEEGVFQG